MITCYRNVLIEYMTYFFNYRLSFNVDLAICIEAASLGVGRVTTHDNPT